MECGTLPDQVELLRQDIAERYAHDSVEYCTYRVFDTFELTLCDSCAIGIGSYRPEYFGLAGNRRLGFEELDLLKRITAPSLGKDKYCPECKKRVAFIDVVLKVRECNAS